MARPSAALLVPTQADCIDAIVDTWHSLGPALREFRLQKEDGQFQQLARTHAVFRLYSANEEVVLKIYCRCVPKLDDRLRALRLHK